MQKVLETDTSEKKNREINMLHFMNSIDQSSQNTDWM